MDFFKYQMFRQANASSEFTGISKETTKATNSIKIFEEKYPIDINKLIERLHEPECITTLAACVESIKLDSSAVSYCLIVPTESKPLADRTQSLVSIIPKLLYIIELNTNVDCQLDTEMIATPSEGDPDHKVTVLKSFRENYSYHIRTTSTNIQIQALNNPNIFYNVFSTFSINTEQIDCRVYLFDSKTFLGSHYELAPHSIVPLDNESTGPLENSDNFDIHNQPESVENDISVHRHLLIDKLKHASAIPVVDEIRR